VVERFEFKKLKENSFFEKEKESENIKRWWNVAKRFTGGRRANFK
jgi:hypothetical protein